MKKFIFGVLVLFLLPVFMQAQSRETIYLKNGSIIKGTIIEHVIGETIKVQTADGSIFVYKESEVDKIEQAKEPEPATIQTPEVVQPVSITPTTTIVVTPPFEGWKIGVGAGWDYRWYPSSSGDQTIETLRSGANFEGHVFAEYCPGNKLGFESGLMYSFRKIYFPGSTTDINAHYFGFPLTFKYYMGKQKNSFHGFVSLYCNFLVGSKLTGTTSSGVSGSASVSDYLGAVDFGPAIGFGVAGFVFEMGYSWANFWNSDNFEKMTGAPINSTARYIRLSYTLPILTLKK